MGIEGYAQIAALAGEKDEAKKYHKIAVDMASDWEKARKSRRSLSACIWRRKKKITGA